MGCEVVQSGRNVPAYPSLCNINMRLFYINIGFLNSNTFLQCYETCPSAGRNCPVSEIRRKFKRQLDEEGQYFNSYVINLDSTCRLNK
jgi:hypothetical protein